MHRVRVFRPTPVPPGEPQRLARLTLVAGLVLLGLWILRPFLPALIWAAILGIALWPLYRRAERRWPPGRSNLLLPALFTLLVALVFIAPLVLAAFQAAREAHDVLAWLHEVRASGIPVPDWVARLPIGGPVEAWWRENLTQPGGSSDLLQRLDRGTLLGLTREVGTQFAHRLVLFGFTLLALFFVFRDGRAFRAQLEVAGNRLFGPRGERVGRQMVASVHGTVNGLVLVGLGEGVLLGAAYFATGVPHPVLLGLMTAVAAMIPFGAPLVFGAAALLLLGQGAVGAALAIVALGLVVLAVADHVVRPALIGGATELPFVWVLFGILGGVETLGLLGLFVGPAVMAALVLLWRDLTQGASAEEVGLPAVEGKPNSSEGKALQTSV